MGLVVFSGDVDRLASFYENVLDLKSHREDSGDVRLTGRGEEILVHSIAPHIASQFTIARPPVERHESALKPIFDVPSLELALDRVREFEGVVTTRTFSLAGLVRHDVLDPDGNVIQLRSPAH